jgi:hypothetical protein
MMTLGTEYQQEQEASHEPCEETRALIHQLTSSMMCEVKTIQKAFELVDVDKSGFIDAAEMARVFEMFHVPCSRENLLDIFESYDTDQDNRFCYEEFEKVFADMTVKQQDQDQDQEEVPTKSPPPKEKGEVEEKTTSEELKSV